MMEINKILNLEPKEEQVEKLIEYKLECQKEINRWTEIIEIHKKWNKKSEEDFINYHLHNLEYDYKEMSKAQENLITKEIELNKLNKILSEHLQ
tara:strand:+ start:111 stop:392 length:282 start_codon:yes stop_codon:yes gene_type:complete